MADNEVGGLPGEVDQGAGGIPVDEAGLHVQVRIPRADVRGRGPDEIRGEGARIDPDRHRVRHKGWIGHRPVEYVDHVQRHPVTDRQRGGEVDGARCLR